MGVTRAVALTAATVFGLAAQQLSQAVVESTKVPLDKALLDSEVAQPGGVVLETREQVLALAREVRTALFCRLVFGRQGSPIESPDFGVRVGVGNICDLDQIDTVTIRNGSTHEIIAARSDLIRGEVVPFAIQGPVA